MAYPTIANYTTGMTASNATSTSITVPSGTQAGDLMLLLISKDGTGLFTNPSGWTQLAQRAYSGQSVAGYYRQLTAPLSNFTIAHASEMTAWILLQIPGGDIPQISSYVDGSSTAPNPPSLTHSFVAGTEVMWLAMMGHDYNRTTSAYPSNFPDNRINSRSTATGGSGVSMATLNSTTNPQDPSAFTISSKDTWTAYTLAIRLSSRTLTVGSGGNGSTTPTTGVHNYSHGSVVTLTANPSAGSYFKKWVVDGVDVFTASTQVTMTSEKTATAYFADYKELSGDIETGVETSSTIVLRVSLSGISESGVESVSTLSKIAGLSLLSENATETSSVLGRILNLSGSAETGSETAVELEFDVPLVMRLDSLLNLTVKGEIVEGSVVNVDRYGVLTIVEIIEGNYFSLSPTGILTVNTVEEGI